MVNNNSEPSFTYDHSLGYVHKGLGTSHVSDCSRYDVFNNSVEELRHDNFKENGKRSLCDASHDIDGCKRAKQIDNTDSFQGSPPPDEVACSGCFDLPWMNLSSPIWVPTFPSCSDSQTVIHCNNVREIHSPVREPSPVHEDLYKPVAIGPNHQAVIPDWNSPSVTDKDAESEKWIRCCVSPMPNSDPFSSCNIYCDCPDEGSMRCVRQHIAEEREDLIRVFEQVKFAKLGFSEMGEEVALKWTAEEEKLFQEVVSSNPKSLHKNFWDDLLTAFPNKSSRDLVSYYFNVFILRKRAEQNRWDPSHIDSDDDEWHKPQSKPQVDEQVEEEEEQVEEEYENESVIDSLTDQDELTENVYVREVSSEQSAEDEYYECAIPRESKVEEPYFDFGALKEDGNTDSCTSFDESLYCAGTNNGFGIVSNDGFLDDLKAWDIDFPYGNGIGDFLSTCNVVDEVIGMEAWGNFDNGGDGIF